MAISVEQKQAAAAISPVAVDAIEIQLLLDGLAQLTGHDFREYDPALVRRRIASCMQAERLATVSGLQEKAFHNSDALERLLTALTLRRVALFTEPGFYKAVTANVIPLLRTYPFLRVWQVGCSTGEEAYSLAILLAEQGLYKRCKIYATEVLDSVVEQARNGKYDHEASRDWAKNYIAAGGSGSVFDYFETGEDELVVKDVIRENIIFARHNITTDASFNEFHLVVCRHVLNQFRPALQSKVHRLLYDSSIRLGFLGLGNGESIQFSPQEECFRQVVADIPIFRRMR